MGRRRALPRARHLRPPLRRGVRRHRHRDAPRARRDRGGLEGLRDERAHPRGAGARLARAEARRLATSRRTRYLPTLASGEWLRRLRADRGRVGLGLGRDADDRAARRRRVRPRRRRSASSRTRRVADLYTVFAKTDPEAGHAGISAFVVEADAPGLRGRAARAEDGDLRARRPASSSSTAAASRPRTCSGEEGEGFRIAMRILDRSRPGVAAQGARHRAGRDRLRARVRAARARRWASRSPSTS